MSEDELLDGMQELSVSEGLLIAPEGAALIPALTRLISRGDISRDERVVLLNTGNALKYTHLVQRPPVSLIDPLPS